MSPLFLSFVCPQLHCALTEETRHIINEETLKLIDTAVWSGATPAVNSQGAWGQGRRDSIEPNQAAWEAVLSKPPYNGS